MQHTRRERGHQRSCCVAVPLIEARQLHRMAAGATTRVLGNCHVPFRAELADFRELALPLPAPPDRRTGGGSLASNGVHQGGAPGGPREGRRLPRRATRPTPRTPGRRDRPPSSRRAERLRRRRGGLLVLPRSQGAVEVLQPGQHRDRRPRHRRSPARRLVGPRGAAATVKRSVRRPCRHSQS